MADAAAKAERPKGFKLLAAALGNRKAATMLGFGFASGLPFALVVGTLNAWLGEVGVNLATIGVLSWIGLAYSFKFLWSPIVDRVKLPGLEALGRRKSWIALCQALLVIAFVLLALTDPTTAIGRFAVIAFIGAIASARRTSRSTAGGSTRRVTMHQSSCFPRSTSSDTGPPRSSAAL
ncbi:MAG: hypothetical protein ACKOOL_06545 [Novosphingobium sp.]